jgi:hypothetical protein
VTQPTEGDAARIQVVRWLVLQHHLYVLHGGTQGLFLSDTNRRLIEATRPNTPIPPLHDPRCRANGCVAQKEGAGADWRCPGVTFLDCLKLAEQVWLANRTLSFADLFRVALREGRGGYNPSTVATALRMLVEAYE